LDLARRSFGGGFGMNAEVNLPVRRRDMVRVSAETEFLEPVRALVEAPVSPIRIHMMLAICAMMTLLLIGSWVGYIDIYAVARGRVEPSGRTKIVQPPNSGKVEAIFVRDGDAVVAGQELIRLDPADAQSKLTELLSRRLIYEAENVRYT